MCKVNELELQGKTDLNANSNINMNLNEWAAAAVLITACLSISADIAYGIKEYFKYKSSQQLVEHIE